MTRRIWVTLVGLLLSALPAAAQTGNEEAICRNDPNVFFCENWEDRPVGTSGASFNPALYKNNGWAQSANVNGVVTGNAFTGTKSLRLVTPANGTSGGAIDTGLPGGPRRTVYWRWYQKWSPNYIWSPVATKNFEHLVNGQAASGVFSSVSNNGFRQPMFLWFSETCWKSLAAGGTTGCYSLPNTNGSFTQFNVDQWYCLETRTTMNTCATCADGTLEAWVDGVLRWSYPNINVYSRNASGTGLVDNPLITGFFLVTYWNCDAVENCALYPHPEMYRYMDNMIGSTQRIGCLGPSDTISPSTPPGLVAQ